MGAEMYDSAFSMGEEVAQIMTESGISQKYIHGLIPMFLGDSKDAYMGFIMGINGNKVYSASTESSKNNNPKITETPDPLSRTEIDNIIKKHSGRGR